MIQCLQETIELQSDGQFVQRNFYTFMIFFKKKIMSYRYCIVEYGGDN